MANDVYIVIESGNTVYYFDQENFYKFVNRVKDEDEPEEEENEEDQEEAEEFIFLESFPLSNNLATMEDTQSAPRDEENRPIGEYCPSRAWPGDEYLYVMKNGIGGFQPSKKIVQKTVTAIEFCDPPVKPKRTRTRTPAQKQARRRR